MDIHKLLISVLMLGCILLVACAPVTTKGPTAIPPTDTGPSTDLPIIQPTSKAAVALPVSETKALATVTGNYSYNFLGKKFNFVLNTDGSYISLASSGKFSVTADQITFVESNSDCASQPGEYKWLLDNNVLHLISVHDDCQRRVNVLGSQKFEKLPGNNTSAAVIWEIPATVNGITTDTAGNVYITDGNTSYSKFDADGKLLDSWSNGLTYTTGIAVDSQGNIYVANFDPPAIHKFSPEGNPILTWTIADGIGPVGLAVDPQGNVYVALHRIHDHYIEKYDPLGNLLGTWAKPDTAGGQIKAGLRTGPSSLAVAVNGDTYIQDDEQASKYDKAGYFLYGIPQKCSLAVDSQGNLYLSISEDGSILKFDSDGKQIGKWSVSIPGLPSGNSYGIAVDKNNDILLYSDAVLAKIKLPAQ